MPSTSKTANLSLNQWAATDGVCREDFNADNLAIDAAVGAVPLKKLKEVTMTEAAASVEFDLSDIDMSGYLEIWMDIRLGVSYAAGDNSYLRFNGYSGASDYMDTRFYSGDLLYSDISAIRLYTGLHRFVLGDTLCCFKPTYAAYGEILSTVLAPEAWTSITFFVSSGTIPAGGTVRIYGVKKI